jgi:hypothetical protein
MLDVSRVGSYGSAVMLWKHMQFCCQAQCCSWHLASQQVKLTASV